MSMAAPISATGDCIRTPESAPKHQWPSPHPVAPPIPQSPKPNHHQHTCRQLYNCNVAIAIENGDVIRRLRDVGRRSFARASAAVFETCSQRRRRLGQVRPWMVGAPLGAAHGLWRSGQDRGRSSKKMKLCRATRHECDVAPPMLERPRQPQAGSHVLIRPPRWLR